jgi:Fe-S cluster biogenesis protein NfuA
LNLIGGQSTCPSFFSGLKDAISTDLKNEKSNSANTQQQAREILTNALNQLKALFN